MKHWTLSPFGKVFKAGGRFWGEDSPLNGGWQIKYLRGTGPGVSPRHENPAKPSKATDGRALFFHLTVNFGVVS